MDQTVIVIDDSLTVRKILEASLSRAGFAVYSFSDGLQAVQALTARQTPIPDAVLLDIGLPKMDGYAVARTLKRQPALHHTVIIMLSGHERRLDKFRGRLAGASAYVTKPFQPAQVLAVLRSHLAAREPAHQVVAKGKAPASTGTSGASA
jgi:twitching motility two-component system response regulator PilG